MNRQQDEQFNQEHVDLLEEYVDDLQNERGSSALKKAGENPEILHLMKTAKELKVLSNKDVQVRPEFAKNLQKQILSDREERDEDYNFSTSSEETPRRKKRVSRFFGVTIATASTAVAVLAIIFVSKDTSLFHQDTVVKNNVNTQVEQNSNAQKNSNIITNTSKELAANNNTNTEKSNSGNNTNTKSNNTNAGTDNSTQGNALAGNLTNTNDSADPTQKSFEATPTFSQAATELGLTDPYQYASYDTSLTTLATDVNTVDMTWSTLMNDPALNTITNDTTVIQF